MIKIYTCLFYLLVALPLAAQPILKLEPVTTGVSGTIGIAHAGDERLFVILQSGLIRIIGPDRQVLPGHFLNITDRLTSGGERGLLGLAFHPDYASNGYFYVNYTDRNGDTVVSRFKVKDDNPDSADSLSEQILLQIAQPFSNHNGGDIKFGPDGYLYISMGDGGSGGDPQNNSQTPGNLLGKMLRIDVDGEAPYGIPANNPFADNQDTLPEIWSMGLRNAWRFSFDAVTGDIWIADVGQNEIEEVNFAPAGSPGGENYGWRCYEGSEPYNLNGCGPSSRYTFPVFEYTQDAGDRSITGGYVYRGSDYPLLQGYYICADFVSGRFFTVHRDGDEWAGSENKRFAAGQFATFGEDIHGELYAAARGQGIIYRVGELCSDFVPELVYDTALVVQLSNAALPDDDVRLEWYNEDGLIAGQDGDTLIPDTEGYHWVVVIHDEGCRLVSDSVFVEFQTNATGRTILDSSVDVFPNPADAFVWVRSRLDEQVTYTMHTPDGRLVAAGILPAGGQIRVDIQGPRQLYLLSLGSSQAVSHKKVLAGSR